MEEKQLNEKLADAELAVKELYDLRDRFFEIYPIEMADKKYKILKEKMVDIVDNIQKMESHTDFRTKSKEFKFRGSFIKGKALNILQDYSADAEEALSRAVKLDPTSIEAWNNLGECYWKKKDMEAAKTCLLDAIKRSKNKESLRKYSMVLRQLGQDHDEKSSNVTESVVIAKEAVSLDVSDGNSWCNAYLAQFFAGGQSPKILQQSLSAYSQAERDPAMANNPDLHFNRATIFKFQEDYQRTLEEYQRAYQLEPIWTEAKERLDDVTSYLMKIMELIETKGKIKQKRLTAMLASLSEKDLGPYAGGRYTSPSGMAINLKHVEIANIVLGINSERLINGKILGVLSYIEPVPYVFIIADTEHDIVAVSVYNLAQEKRFNIGDSVAIPEPYLQINDFEFNGQRFRFSGIRVDNPVVMVINGTKLGRKSASPMFLSITTKSE